MKLSLAANNETGALLFIISLLGLNSLFNSIAGFSLPVFLITIPISTALSCLYPRIGLTAAVILTVIFERFFALESLVIGNNSIKLYPLDLILGGVFIGTIITYFKNKKTNPSLNKTDYFLIAFFTWVTIIFLTNIINPNNLSLSTAFSTWKNYVFYGSLFFTIPILLPDKTAIINFGKLFLLGVAFSGIFLLIGLTRGLGLWTEYTPLSTTGVRFLAFTHAFYFSLALIISLCTMPLWIKKISKSQLMISAVWLTVLVIGIIGSLMRHLWLGLAITITSVFITAPKTMSLTWAKFTLKSLIPSLITLSLLFGLFSLQKTQSLNNNLTNLGTRVTSISNPADQSTAWRLVVWSEVIEKFKTKPILGLGFGQEVDIKIGDYEAAVEVRNMHNSWLAILTQTGLVGAILFLAFLGLLLLKTISIQLKKQPGHELTLALIGLLIFQAFVLNFQPYLETNMFNLFFWLTLGLMQALNNQTIIKKLTN